MVSEAEEDMAELMGSSGAWPRSSASLLRYVLSLFSLSTGFLLLALFAAFFLFLTFLTNPDRETGMPEPDMMI